MSLEPHPDRRVAVVSGASAGIGAATAAVLAAAGYPVALGARRADRCEELAEKIRANGGEAIGLQLDVTDPESVHQFALAVEERLGVPEIVVSNAGTVVMMGATEASTDQIKHDLDVNVLGAHRLIAAFVPGMVERERGDIVFVSSDSVYAMRPGVAGYITSKGGLEGLAGALRADLEGTGVRASVVRPGPTVTEIHTNWDMDRLGEVYQTWKRWGVQRHNGFLQAENVGHAILAVASAPRGMHLPLVEVQPEAPVRRRDRSSS